MTNGYAQATFIMKRPKNFNEEIKTRIKAMKIVSKHFNAHTLPYDNPETATKSGSYAIVNDSNPVTFTIEVFAPQNKINSKDFKKITNTCNKELKKLENVKPVICYS